MLHHVWATAAAALVLFSGTPAADGLTAIVDTSPAAPAAASAGAPAMPDGPDGPDRTPMDAMHAAMTADMPVDVRAGCDAMHAAMPDGIERHAHDNGLGHMSERHAFHHPRR